jgi:hypothetical protein
VGNLDGRGRCCCASGVAGATYGGTGATPTGRGLERGVLASTPLCGHLRCLGVSHGPRRRCANLGWVGLHCTRGTTRTRGRPMVSSSSGTCHSPLPRALPVVAHLYRGCGGLPPLLTRRSKVRVALGASGRREALSSRSLREGPYQQHGPCRRMLHVGSNLTSLPA